MTEINKEFLKLAEYYKNLVSDIEESSEKLSTIINTHVEVNGASLMDLVSDDPLTIEILTAIITEAVNVAEYLGIVKVG